MSKQIAIKLSTQELAILQLAVSEKSQKFQASLKDVSCLDDKIMSKSMKEDRSQQLRKLIRTVRGIANKLSKAVPQ